MLEVKLFEVRAEQTFIPILCVRLDPTHAQLDLLKVQLSMGPEQLEVYQSQEQARGRQPAFSELAAGVIPALQILAQLSSPEQEEQERWLLRKVGFLVCQQPLVMVSKLSSLSQTFYTANQWTCPTLRAAHEHIEAQWESLRSGQVIDVDFIQGLREEPRESERASTLCTHLPSGHQTYRE